MPKFLKDYLDDSLPLNERIFCLATLSSSVAGLLFVFFAVLIRTDIRAVCLYASICIMAAAFLFLERRCHKTTFLSIIFITYANFFAFPTIMYLQSRSVVEIPVYSIIGLCYALVLLEGAERIVLFVSQAIFDISITYYCFVYRHRGLVNYGAMSSQDYLRVEVAVVVTGLLCSTIIYYRNVMLQKELQLSETAKENAEDVSDAKDIFLVNVSHEIRTPLNAILGTTEMLMNDDINNRLREMTFNISNSSHALLSITSDLLDFSRMNIDALDTNVDEYDISAMINDVINLMSVRLLDRNIEFIVEVNPTLPKNLCGDSPKIRQIISNLLSNAIKFTEEGYMKFIVDYKEIDDENIRLMVVVEDSGVGIDKDELNRIFNQANVGNARRNPDEPGGTGMGLAFCNRLCKIMGGNISVQSVRGEGSTFYFEVNQKVAGTRENRAGIGNLKSREMSVCYFSDGLGDMASLDKVFLSMGIESFAAYNEDEFIHEFRNSDYSWFILSSVSYERIKEKMINSSVDWDKVVVVISSNYSYSEEPFRKILTKPVSCLNIAALANGENSYFVRSQRFEGAFDIPEATILVVDDNLVNLEVGAGLLKRYGCRVLTSAGGKEALITLQDEHVDMIFLDYMMPDMDGIDTLKAIRALSDERYKTMPIICLTANAVSGAKEMFLDAGFDGYLSKPIETDKLDKMILEKLPKEFIRVALRKE